MLFYDCLKMPEERRNASQVNFVELLNCLNPQLKAQVRSLEKLNKRKVQALFGVKFNQTCINENVLPNYTDIYIYIQIRCTEVSPSVYIIII